MATEEAESKDQASRRDHNTKIILPLFKSKTLEDTTLKKSTSLKLRKVSSKLYSTNKENRIQLLFD